MSISALQTLAKVSRHAWNLFVVETTDVSLTDI